jgi:hypothetical protein
MPPSQDERILVELHEPRGEDRAHERPQRGAQGLLAAGEGVAQLARHPLRAQSLRLGHLYRSEFERALELADELGLRRLDQRSRSALQRLAA